MKIAVSIPDDLFEGAELLAKRLRTSRSELFSRALREYLARHGADEVTETLDRVLDRVGASDQATEATDVAAAGRRRLRAVEW